MKRLFVREKKNLFIFYIIMFILNVIKVRGRTDRSEWPKL